MPRYLTPLLLALLLPGCRPAAPTVRSTTPPPDLSRIDLLNDSSGELTSESWSVHRVRGFKMGHQWSRTYKFRLGEAPAERTIVVDELLIPRFGQANNQILRAAAVYDAGGRLLEMEYELESNSQRRRLVAKVVDSRLYVLRLNDQQRQLTQQDWNPDNGGFFAIERSLAKSPLQPGERRVIQAWLPLVDQPQSFRLSASPSSETPSSETPITVTLADQPEDAPVGLRLWIDHTGAIVRRWRRTLDQTTERADKVAALLPNEPLRFDIALDVRIPFADAPPNMDSATEASYRVQLTDANPLQLIPQCGYQRVTALDERTAIVSVRTDLTERPSEAASLPEAVPDADSVQANFWLEVKDPALQNFVRRIAGDVGSNDTLLERLRQGVADELRETALGNTLTTAAGALRAKAGDCTEHAMLLAAACRACQIPARVAVGVVYQQQTESFLYHMWTEAWNGHDWQPLDALADSAIPPANRIKLLHSDLSKESDYELVAPFSLIIGHMKILKSGG